MYTAIISNKRKFIEITTTFNVPVIYSMIVRRLFLIAGSLCNELGC